jgi:hypothetical protein
MYTCAEKCHSTTVAHIRAVDTSLDPLIFFWIVNVVPNDSLCLLPSLLQNTSVPKIFSTIQAGASTIAQQMEGVDSMTHANHNLICISIMLQGINHFVAVKKHARLRLAA